METRLKELLARAKVENWEQLELYNRKLKVLPPEIGDLPTLKKINLERNQIINLPESIGNLVNLEYFEIHSNQITNLPESIGDLISLEYFEIHSNQIHNLPDSIGNLTNLQRLDLDNNQITYLPDSIGNLINLKRLDLDNNQITYLPNSIKNLIHLEHLCLRNNKITYLPDSIGDLTSLKSLDLRDNHITNIPYEIIYHGYKNPSIIVEYIKQKVRGNSRPLNEAKLILVGFGGVGKTSLVKRLVHDDFDKDESQTHEVQITKWDVTLNTQSAENILVHTWDFGGQQIMHSTHQFFLTERSLYILVLNGRQGQEDEDAEYWLELIKSFGKDSQVIVVLNKSNSTPFDVNRTDLRQKFPNIIRDGFISTDCQSCQGIDSLKQIIIRELDKVEGLRASFPTKWFSIKDRLAAMTENYINFEDYRKICQSYGEDNPEKQEKLAYYLHLLGIALNYADDNRLRDTNILNPHWVTKGVYRVITSDILNQNLGKLDRSHLAKILSPQEYPRSCYDFLLCLMRKFELCFPFPETSDLYLIPNLLSKQQPEITTQFDPNECLNFRYAYPVLPEGLLPRFIVRTHEMNKTKAWWRSGTVLAFEGSRALVKADRVDKSVSISIKDGSNDNQRRLLAIIRSNFDAIHSNFEFTVTELVPIPKDPQTYHSYQKLLAFEKKGIPDVNDLINGEVVTTSVEELLNGIKSPAQRRFDRERDLSIRKDETISGNSPTYNVRRDLIIGDKIGKDKTENY